MAIGKKTGGREKGTPNKFNVGIRERIGSYVDNSLDSLMKDIEQLEIKDRVRARLELLQYRLPKYQSQSIRIENLSDELLDQLIEEIKGRQ